MVPKYEVEVLLMKIILAVMGQMQGDFSLRNPKDELAANCFTRGLSLFITVLDEKMLLLGDFCRARTLLLTLDILLLFLEIKNITQ